jgi:hypothetical protein
MTAIEFSPDGFFNWRTYRLVQNETQVGEIDCGHLGEKATIIAGGTRYTAGRDRAMSGRFYMVTSGNLIASANKPSAFRNVFEVHAGPRTFTLKPASRWRRGFVLAENEVTLGPIAPQGFFSRRSRADLPDDLPLPTKAFLIWLVILIWRRQVLAASVAGALAVATPH